jgi:hypothetical protein
MKCFQQFILITLIQIRRTTIGTNNQVKVLVEVPTLILI